MGTAFWTEVKSCYSKAEQEAVTLNIDGTSLDLFFELAARIWSVWKRLLLEVSL